MTKLSDELWLAVRLRREGITLFDGLTTTEQRRSRARELILSKSLQDTSCGTKNGEKQSFSQVFQAIYGEAL